MHMHDKTDVFVEIIVQLERSYSLFTFLFALLKNRFGVSCKDAVSINETSCVHFITATILGLYVEYDLKSAKRKLSNDHFLNCRS